MTEQLERTAAVDEVIEALQHPTRPDLRFLPRPAWRLAQLPATHQINLVTAGLLGSELRTRFAIPWSRTRQREFQLLSTSSRAVTPLLPRQLRNVGPSYLRWRQAAIAAPS